mgnify:CR=1 FL=1
MCKFTSLYGGTWTLFTQTFKKLGIEVRFFEPHILHESLELRFNWLMLFDPHYEYYC